MLLTQSDSISTGIVKARSSALPTHRQGARLRSFLPPRCDSNRQLHHRSAPIARSSGLHTYLPIPSQPTCKLALYQLAFPRFHSLLAHLCAFSLTDPRKILIVITLANLPFKMSSIPLAAFSAPAIHEVIRKQRQQRQRDGQNKKFGNTNKMEEPSQKTQCK